MAFCVFLDSLKFVNFFDVYSCYVRHMRGEKASGMDQLRGLLVHPQKKSGTWSHIAPGSQNGCPWWRIAPDWPAKKAIPATSA